VHLRTPLQRIKQGAVFLTVVFVVAVCGYHYLGDYGWDEAIWMVVVTISTVGYAEHSTLQPLLQVFTVFVILLGMSAAAYTFGGLIQLMLEGEIDRVIGTVRMTKELKQISDHIIICGFGRIGQNLAAELESQKRAVVVVETNVETAQDASSRGFMTVVGDATEESVLRAAGIERAGTIVAALPSDAESVFITLTARNLNDKLQIIARAEHASTEGKLRQAGANRVVMPTVVSANQMLRMITRPTTAELMDLVSQSDFQELELDEVLITGDSRLNGMTIGQAQTHRDHNVLVVAVKRSDGALVFNPGESHGFQTDDIVMLVGHRNDIRTFRHEFGLT
jgi:voltage-gated potassium channel